jgi:hypothetical protein
MFEKSQGLGVYNDFKGCRDFKVQGCRDLRV